jgi:hypothetical protein
MMERGILNLTPEKLGRFQGQGTTQRAGSRGKTAATTIDAEKTALRRISWRCLPLSLRGHGE